MTIRTQTPPPVLTNTRYGLTTEEIEARFPAVFADTPEESVSSRYMMVRTHQYLTDLRNNFGYVPTVVMHQKARIERPGQLEKGKHLIRFTHVDDLSISQGERHELVIVNSHNRTSGFKFMSGLFRFICQNGMILATLDNSLSVQHRGNQDMLEAIRQAVWQIAAQGVHVMEEVEIMKQVMLSWDEQLMLSEACMVHRFPQIEVNVVESDNSPVSVIDRSMVPFQPEDFLRPQYGRYEDYVVGGRRTWDTGDRSLYVTGQVIQENMVTKPVKSTGRNNSGHRSSTRTINGIDGNIRTNAGIALMQRSMAALKGVKFDQDQG